jgi:multisubunit Na+/H+ antiporter MnhE subunit
MKPLHSAGEHKQSGRVTESPGRRALFWFAEFGILLGLWMLFVSKPAWDEFAIGLAAAAIAATASEVVRGHNIARFYPQIGDVAQGLRIPWYIVSGTADVTKVLAQQLFAGKPADSIVQSVAFDSGNVEAIMHERSALAVAYTTITPNFVVIDVDVKRRVLLYHQLTRTPVLTMTQALGARP